MKTKQLGITLVEILISVALSAFLFALLMQSSQKMLDSYLITQSYNYRQSVLLDGWWSLVNNVKRVSSPNLYYYLSPNNKNPSRMEFLSNRLYSGTNNIVFSESDLIGLSKLPAIYRTSARTGASNVDIPSDQLVIQYTMAQANTTDCEGNAITPYDKLPNFIGIGDTPVLTTIIERYYVKKENGQLNLKCDAMRYNSSAGITGGETGERTVVPNIDYFHVLFVGKQGYNKYLTIDKIYETLGGKPLESNIITRDPNIEASIKKSNASNRFIAGVEMSMLFHAPFVANTGATPLNPKQTFTVLDNTVTLNNGATTNDAIYDLATSFVTLNFYKKAD